MISPETTALVETTRPAGITLLAGVSAVLALVYFLFGCLTYAQTLPLASGAFLLGPGLEIYGPLMFFVFGVLYGRLAFDLWRLRRWGRYLGIILAGLGVYLLAPSISSAVVDMRVGAIAGDGLQIALRVAAMWYLTQPQVKAAFGS